MPIPVQCQCDGAGHQVILAFNKLFVETHKTCLICALCDGRQGDRDEPVYEPANTGRPLHQIVFAHGYFSSALHEISHWCVAGSERRLLEDFGYWYRPDGRTQEQQVQFEQVEVKPQAIEWLLSLACKQAFVASADNLGGEARDDLDFRLAVSAQARRYLLHGLPEQAAQLLVSLEAVFGGEVTLAQLYWPEELREKCLTSD